MGIYFFFFDFSCPRITQNKYHPEQIITWTNLGAIFPSGAHYALTQKSKNSRRKQTFKAKEPAPDVYKLQIY
jgi:hypothetical protein